MLSNPTPKFLIDANLPRFFSLRKGDGFIHQSEIDDTWTDEQIWEFATQNNLTIGTKDSDFSNKIIFHIPLPKVMTTVWQDAVELSETHKLVNVFRDRIEGIE